MGRRQEIVKMHRDSGEHRTHVTPESPTWDDWVASTARYTKLGERLIQVDIGRNEIQLSFESSEN